MLPPVRSVSSSSLSFHDQPQQNGGNPTGGTTASVALPSVTTSAANTIPAGKIDVLALSGQVHLSQSMTVVAETLGRIINLPRGQGEAIADYLNRLAETLKAMNPSERAAVERQLNQIFQGATLRALTEILKNPAGPEAAKLAVYLEMARYKGRDLVARAVVTSYRQNAGAEQTGTARPQQPGAALNGNTLPATPAKAATGEPENGRPVIQPATTGSSEFSVPPRREEVISAVNPRAGGERPAASPTGQGRGSDVTGKAPAAGAQLPAQSAAADGRAAANTAPDVSLRGTVVADGAAARRDPVSPNVATAGRISQNPVSVMGGNSRPAERVDQASNHHANPRLVVSGRSPAQPDMKGGMGLPPLTSDEGLQLLAMLSADAARTLPAGLRGAFSSLPANPALFSPSAPNGASGESTVAKSAIAAQAAVPVEVGDERVQDLVRMRDVPLNQAQLMEQQMAQLRPSLGSREGLGLPYIAHLQPQENEEPSGPHRGKWSSGGEDEGGQDKGEGERQDPEEILTDDPAQEEDVAGVVLSGDEAEEQSGEVLDVPDAYELYMRMGGLG